MESKTFLSQLRKRVFTIIEIGTHGDTLSKGYDLLYCLLFLANLTAAILGTFQSVHTRYGSLLSGVEMVTAATFILDYLLRIWTARELFPQVSGGKAVLRYLSSFYGIVDLLSFLPYCLPGLIPVGIAAFRIVRVVRIFRLFRITAYYDSLSIIADVIRSKRQQLVSSVFILLVLMTASSLCMYSLEHPAQPEVFCNAFSGLWWAVSTLLTVGYGDIYPITPAGQFVGIVISFLGVGMVAIPTGIISAAFVEQYSKVKRFTEYAQESDVRFLKFQLTSYDQWVGTELRNLGLPSGVLPALVQRGDEVLLPRGNLTLQEGDVLVLGAETFENGKFLDLKEITLGEQHPWNGLPIRDLDISRQTIIVLVERHGNRIIPRGDLVLRAGDQVLLYSQTRMTDADLIQL